MIKAVLFDLDNTLIDFIEMKKRSCDAAISSMIGAGLNVNKQKAIKVLFDIYDVYGYEDRLVLQKFLLKVLKKVDYRILAYGIVAYRRVRSSFLEPYPHTSYVLLKLKSKGIKLAIVTDAPKIKAWIRLASMKIADFFDIVVTFEDTRRLKPNKMPFKAALKQLKLKPEECLMVGDMPQRDILGAKKLGIKTCFASYGSRKPKKVDSDYVIKDIKDLLKIV